MNLLTVFTALYTVPQGFANTKKNLDWLIIDRMMHLVANLGTANFSIWSSFQRYEWVSDHNSDFFFAHNILLLIFTSNTWHL